MPSFPKQAANSLVTETSQYFVFFCRSVCSAILAKCLIINVLRLIIVILFFIAFLNITYTARHTWATTAYQKKCATGVICNALGHSSIKVTETYLKAFEQKEIDRTNRMIISYVKQEAEKANKNRNILFNTL
ncbi:tyrosine-type recombinase/integrase [Bacteroides ovatus]|uniref:Tyrosine-type recombinase/integrase n=1 Tax=Bacteroides ovatus TaxID=28116 RepID=A0A5M5AYB5_BACOV|nr:tyrosine-type recombinase/integrase [Bacteroides ovatus]MSL98486.1 tyrosine-type recombinase/integrase [Escherichia coli]KAA3799426.1 tyrosine-type recombinase/integrase [Bacteroides ovatus]KAA3800108.1 tyrosine-type recombinase/integrase [Bacteroides ovatus]KAA3808957.1 tyrosine-type recombinase/integrase [Bacteroides ovatus]